MSVCSLSGCSCKSLRARTSTETLPSSGVDLCSVYVVL